MTGRILTVEYNFFSRSVDKIYCIVNVPVVASRLQQSGVFFPLHNKKQLKRYWNKPKGVIIQF